jgi:hypothetical protein
VTSRRLSSISAIATASRVISLPARATNSAFSSLSVEVDPIEPVAVSAMVRRDLADWDVRRSGIPGHSAPRNAPKEISVLLLRVLLVLILVVLSGYTAIVISNHGWNLLAVFFGDMSAMAWPGQFNLDFMGFLTLSALWTAWRHHFSPAGLALSVIAFFGGMMFLTTYLLVASCQVKGDVRALLLGTQRAGG